MVQGAHKGKAKAARTRAGSKAKVTKKCNRTMVGSVRTSKKVNKDEVSKAINAKVERVTGSKVAQAGGHLELAGLHREAYAARKEDVAIKDLKGGGPKKNKNRVVSSSTTAADGSAKRKGHTTKLK